MTDDVSVEIRHSRGPLAMVAVAGEVDRRTAGGLRAAGLDLVERGHRHLILDMSGVAFCDSSGLSALIGLWHATRGAEGSLILAAVPDRLRRMLAITGVDTLLAVHETAAEALAAHEPSGEAGSVR